MTLWIILVLVVFLLFAGVLTVFVLRRPGEPLPPPLPSAAEEDPEARRTRQRMLDERETELIERRIELDARRGPLGGNNQVYEAFEELEQRLRSGELSEEEFEAEKIRLLGG